jgi:hypothetical protein
LEGSANAQPIRSNPQKNAKLEIFTTRRSLALDELAMEQAILNTANEVDLTAGNGFYS